MKGFKETEIGLIPEDWNIKELGSIADIKQGKTPKREEYSNNSGYRILKAKDITNLSIIQLKASGERSFVKNKLSDNYLAKKGDIFVLSSAHSKSHVGQKIGFLKESPKTDTFFVAELLRIRVKTDFSLNNFVFYWLLTLIAKKQISNLVSGNHLYPNNLKKLKIPLPPLEEQKAIAKVLDSVRETIEKTENVINALKEFKKSLMENLFTYGAVPYDERDRVELRQTEIGMIPKHWEVSYLEQISLIRGGKRLPKGHRFSERITPYLYIRVSDIRNGKISAKNIRCITDEDANLLRNYRVSKGDIIISIAGTIGLIALVSSEFNGAYLTENAARITNLKTDILNPTYLSYSLQSFIVQKQFNLYSSKTSQPKLALSKLRKTLIPIPPIEEQKEIAEILDKVNSRIEAEERKKEALEELFKTLLNKLMTGKIRVAEEFLNEFKETAETENG